MKIYPSDWLSNAGILGFLRLQKLRGIESDLSRGYAEVKAEDLDDFEEAYFTYALMRGLAYFLRFDSIKKLQKYLPEESYAEVQLEIRELVENARHNIMPNWNDYRKSVESLLGVMNDLAKSVQSIIRRRSPEEEKLRKKIEKVLKDIGDDAEGLIGKLTDRSYNYIYVTLQRFFFNKAVIGNPGFRGDDRKDAFAISYVEPAKRLLSSGSSSGLTCRFCGQNRVEISDWKNVNEFFGEGMFAPTGVSTEKFLNFFYNMQSDLILCDVCELILLCSWAGFTEIPYKFRDEINDTEFIFVNVPNLELLIEENEKLQSLYETSALDLQGTIYEEILYDLFVKEKEKKSEWALQNVLFVEIKPVPRKDQGKPNFRYFHIGKDIAQMFIDQTAIKAAKQIRGRIYTRRNKENPRDSVFVYARRDAVRRMLSRDSLYPLCYAAIRDQIENPNYNNIRNAFNLSVLSGIRTNIWKKNKQGGTPMESKQIFGILKGFSGAGEDLGQGMDYEKRKRLSYRLLSLIRTGKIPDFYESLLKLYISRNKPIPDALVSLLNAADAVEPQAKAYAFMSGFLGQEQAQPVAPIEATSETTN
jgi:CRISPR-associated protein Cas8b1/Cst1 subtype I-B